MEHITVKNETLDKVYNAIKKHELEEVSFEFLPKAPQTYQTLP